MNELAIWVGIGVCLTQSAIFSGLNLAVFSLSRLRLEAVPQAYFSGRFTPAPICHHPLVVREAGRPLGQVLSRLTVQPERPGDDVVDRDLILVWVEGNRRIITGSDLLGRLLRQIARPTAVPSV